MKGKNLIEPGYEAGSEICLGCLCQKGINHYAVKCSVYSIKLKECEESFIRCKQCLESEVKSQGLINI